MKRLIIAVGLLAGFVGTANAGQVVVAGPLEVDNPVPYNVLLCLASNLSNDTQFFNFTVISGFDGIPDSTTMNVGVDALATDVRGHAGGNALCVWEVDGNPETWRFTACVGTNPNLACTGGAVQGRVVPGMRFPG